MVFKLDNVTFRGGCLMVGRRRNLREGVSIKGDNTTL